ncbi:MAG: glyceraldehyde 3-phosphate dehydrogenase NAD-binding domain-containing protein [Nanoarchaeota archaeon]
MKILINGTSGRIGRAVSYELIKSDIIPAALNDPVGIEKIVDSLSGNDAVHGKFNWQINKINADEIEINGKKIKVYAEKSLDKIPFRDLGVSIVEECSGFYGNDKTSPDEIKAREFLSHGVEKVIMSYPATGAGVVTLVAGVNLEAYDSELYWGISNGSCTTKALVAPLQVLRDYGLKVQALLMDTVHAATNTQSILESLNQISTHKTGAAKATGEIIPELKGKMDGLSFRVPTLDGSFANLYFVADSEKDNLSARDINQVLREESSNQKYMGRLAVFEGKEAGTSYDIVGRTENAIVILDKTRVLKLPYKTDSKTSYLIGIVSGYDNERGPPRDQVLVTKHIIERG